MLLLLSLFFFSSTYAPPQAQQNPQWNVGLSPNIKTYFAETTWINTSQPIVISSLWRDNWLNYTVSALGTQQIRYDTRPVKVILDGVERSEGNGWSYSEETGTVTVTTALNSVAIQWEQPTPPPFDWSFVFNFYTAIKIISLSPLILCGILIIFMYRRGDVDPLVLCSVIVLAVLLTVALLIVTSVINALP